MGEKKRNIPYFGCINFYGDGSDIPEDLPKVRVIKCGNKTKNNAPFEVKRPMRSGVRILKTGESIDWRKLYSEG